MQPHTPSTNYSPPRDLLTLFLTMKQDKHWSTGNYDDYPNTKKLGTDRTEMSLDVFVKALVSIPLFLVHNV